MFLDPVNPNERVNICVSLTRVLSFSFNRFHSVDPLLYLIYFGV